MKEGKQSAPRDDLFDLAVNIMTHFGEVLISEIGVVTTRNESKPLMS
jgi:hypothetical protein